MSDQYYRIICHHGIIGQKWGDRNGPPYPLSSSAHSSSERNYSNSNKTGLSNEQKAKIKKYAIIGAATIGTGLAIYGGYRLSKYVKSSAAEKVIKEGSQKVNLILKDADKIHFQNQGLNMSFNRNKENALRELAEQTKIKTNDKANEVSKSLLKSIKELKTKLPVDVNGDTNPLKRKDNCKDVAEAVVKRWLGIDPSAVAGEKTVYGNLHDFVEQRGYNSKGIEWIKSETGGISPNPFGSSKERVSNRILKQFKEGDMGYVSVTHKLRDNYSEYISNNAHAFNWYIKNKEVIFYDDQPEIPLYDASSHFDNLNKNVEIEILKITKEAFTK